MSEKDCVIRADQLKENLTDWGGLSWIIDETRPEFGLNVGFARFAPGKSNPTHFHPNCDEILHLLEGTLEHRLPDGTTTVLQPGDTICLRKGEVHYAKNIGSVDAVAMIIFNDAIRKVTPVSAADGEA